MAVEVSWDDDEHTILRVVLHDWGWEDIANDEAIGARKKLFDAAPRPVTMIILLRDAPKNLLGMLPHMSQSPGFSHPKVRQVIVVADSSIIKIAAEIFQRVYGKASQRLRVAGSLHEAYSIIRAGQTWQRTEHGRQL